MPASVLFLAGAIILEVAATLSLNPAVAARLPASPLLTALAYCGAFYLLSQTIRTMPIGIAYAVWSGFGIVAIALAGRLLLKQPLDAASICGIAMIVCGVIVIALFSQAVKT